MRPLHSLLSTFKRLPESWRSLRRSDLRKVAAGVRRAWRLWTVVVVLVVLVGGVVFGVYYYLTSTDWGDITEGSIVTDSRYREVPEGYYEYRTVPYHFSILFPQELEVKEYGGKGDSLTVTFEDKSGEPKGFQIFATPYNQPVVSGERFRMDNPSGVYKDPVDVSVAGVRATIFYSQNARLGETREAWFIRNGILYEVNARRAHDEWLAAQIQTWQFVR